MNKHSIQLVQRSWTQVTPIAEQAADIFYERLFALDPGLQPRFTGDMKAQGAQRQPMIGVTGNNIDVVATQLPGPPMVAE